MSVKDNTDIPKYLGRLRPTAPFILTNVGKHTLTQQVVLELDLDNQRLEAIEDFRLGRGLTFAVSLWARVQSGTGLDDLVAQDTYSVNRGTWVEVLEQLGYARMMLLEIPVPDSQAAPELAEAVPHLKQAHIAMLRGEYREAVGACRDVLESLSIALGDQDGQDPELPALFANTRQMDKSQRFRVMRRALKVLCHPARHADEVATRIEWNRSDAIAVVTMVGALLAGMTARRI